MCRSEKCWGGMGSQHVVFTPPPFDHDLRFLQAVEDFSVEQFISEFAVEGFAVAVLPRTTWLDVKGLRAYGLQPCAQRLGSKFRTVIGANMLRHTPQQHKVGQSLDHLLAAQASADLDRQTFASELINEREQPQA